MEIATVYRDYIGDMSKGYVHLTWGVNTVCIMYLLPEGAWSFLESHVSALLHHLPPPALCVITFGRLVVNLPSFGWVLLKEESAICAEVRFRSHLEKRFQKSFPRGIQKHMWLPSNVYDKYYIFQASHLSAPGPMSQRSSLPTRVPVQVSTLERLVICDG